MTDKQALLALEAALTALEGRDMLNLLSDYKTLVNRLDNYILAHYNEDSSEDMAKLFNDQTTAIAALMQNHVDNFPI